MVLLLWRIIIKKIRLFHKNQAVNLHQIYSMRLLCCCFILLVGANFNVKAQYSNRIVDSFVKHSVFSPIPQNFYNQQLGIVCKKECQLQSALKANLFIRLGSKEYVDYLERKPNSFIGKRD
jgi:hypothetical protein